MDLSPMNMSQVKQIFTVWKCKGLNLVSGWKNKLFFFHELVVEWKRTMHLAPINMHVNLRPLIFVLYHHTYIHSINLRILYFTLLTKHNLPKCAALWKSYLSLPRQIQQFCASAMHTIQQLGSRAKSRVCQKVMLKCNIKLWRWQKKWKFLSTNGLSKGLGIVI